MIMRVLGCWSVVALLLAGCGDAPLARKVGDIEIRGSARFVEQISRALDLIRRKAPEDFATIEAYVKRVQEHSHSGMNYYAQPPTCELAAPSAFYSVTWCAGCIAHEAHHALLFGQPNHAYGLAEEERQCNEFQMKVLKLIDAPENEISHLASQDGSHFDLNGDGKYTTEDYNQRSW